MNNNRNLVEQQIHETDVGVYAYDKALVEDLRARFQITDDNIDSQINDTVQIGSSSNMFNIIGQLNDDQTILPFISLERINWQLNLDRQRIPNVCSVMRYTLELQMIIYQQM